MKVHTLSPDSGIPSPAPQRKHKDCDKWIVSKDRDCECRLSSKHGSKDQDWEIHMEQDRKIVRNGLSMSPNMNMDD